MSDGTNQHSRVSPAAASAGLAATGPRAAKLLRLMITAVVILGYATPRADAHGGRRFEIEIVNGKLQAQGINSGANDGLPAVRPYINAIHDHWRNVPSLGIATASLPGFDAPASLPALVGHELALELKAVRKWVDPPPMPGPGDRLRLDPLSPGEILTITGASGEINSVSKGVVALTEEVMPGGALDLDLIYQINQTPSEEIHVLEFVLSATPLAGVSSGIEPSDSIYVLLSPDGSTPVERLHHASLFLEQRIATVPEPSAATLSALTLAFLIRPLRRKPASSGVRT